MKYKTFHRTLQEVSRSKGRKLLLGYTLKGGLKALHMLTSDQSYELRVDMKLTRSRTGYATYSNFSISDSSDYYRLHFDGFTGGNGGNGLSKNNNQQFTTLDADHDSKSTYNCATGTPGGWWFDACGSTYLNGPYNANGLGNGIYWFEFNNQETLVFTEMKMRVV